MRNRPISERELEEIRKSAIEAFRRVSISTRAALRERKLASKVYNVAQFKADVLLDELRFSPRPHLCDRHVKPVLVAAIGRDDKRFFIRFGKCLSTRPSQRPNYPSDVKRIREITLRLPPRLVQFVIARWAERSDDLPELFYFTPEGLADVCSHYLGREVSIDAVVKLRQRLGLKPFKRNKINVIRLGKKLKFL